MALRAQPARLVLAAVQKRPPIWLVRDLLPGRKDAAAGRRRALAVAAQPANRPIPGRLPQRPAGQIHLYWGPDQDTSQPPPPHHPLTTAHSADGREQGPLRGHHNALTSAGPMRATHIGPFRTPKRPQRRPRSPSISAARASVDWREHAKSSSRPVTGRRAYAGNGDGLARVWARSGGWALDLPGGSPVSPGGGCQQQPPGKKPGIPQP